MATNNDDKKQAIDVAKPGKSAPDNTARPVIVGHKPLIKEDPMVSGNANKEASEPQDENLSPLHGEKVIEPPKEEQEEAVSSVPATTTKAPDEAIKDQQPAKEKSESDETETKDSPDNEGSGVVGAVADQAAAKKKEEQESEEELKKQEALEKLIEEKKYSVPVKVASRKRNTRTSVIVLVLLLLLVGAYLAADAGIIKVPFKLPVHIIPS